MTDILEVILECPPPLWWSLKARRMGFQLNLPTAIGCFVGVNVPNEMHPSFIVYRNTCFEGQANTS
jgi:hypothetical protein